MTRADYEKKKSLARVLYLSGMPMNEIAQKVGVTLKSLSRWSAEGAWKETRAAKQITRPELVNKLLLTIDNLITRVNESGSPTLIVSLGDKLAKFSAAIERLDKKTSVVDYIEVFMAFSKWLELRSANDRTVTAQLMKDVNRLQDEFVAEQMQINPR